ncbi:hypothetical protein GTNG_2834 [Geobacillus thermodenitrificans NG80-2]|uniref:Uncharacterized protein n=1 Tax=Geobacillus thermodenitrificans (strain NG80-2) TaxID=420246 RepID=A4IS75_GEOTN|nr:hypothetical protein GTNG_2834 [Geobacillus thermodenitrificans NG80-2]
MKAKKRHQRSEERKCLSSKTGDGTEIEYEFRCAWERRAKESETTKQEVIEIKEAKPDTTK